MWRGFCLSITKRPNQKLLYEIFDEAFVEGLDVFIKVVESAQSQKYVSKHRS